MIIRKATVSDTDSLIKTRLDFLTEDFGGLSDSEQTAIMCQLNFYLRSHILDNTFIATLAEINGVIVCAAYLVVSEKPANPFFINGKTGTMLNVYTYPDWRRKGFAIRVIQCLISEARKNEVSCIELLSTNIGKSLYEKLGFRVSNCTSMRITL